MAADGRRSMPRSCSSCGGVMMIAMTVPNAAPTVLLYAAVKRGRNEMRQDAQHQPDRLHCSDFSVIERR
jgi:hypothetical protein